MNDKKENSPPDHLLAPPPLPNSSSCCRSTNYVELNVLGVGGFGRVVRCLKKDTGETVAVKTIECADEQIIALKEVAMLQKLRGLDPDKCHIVRFHEFFHTNCATSLVFEIMDISLYDFLILREFMPLPLTDIRVIVQQLAIAFDALKSIGVIHTDLKPDNIMLVDHLTKPFKVKLIDFGLAIQKSEAKTGSQLQTSFWRSPEIILGLPISEAIDMWSLGCVMFDLYLANPLFPGMCEYGMMQLFVDTLGQPEDHLLDAGLYTKKFFQKTPFYVLRQRWRLLTPEEYARKTFRLFEDVRCHKIHSLDELKEESLDKENRDDDRREFVNLLKEILQIDARKRITPSQILTHPFITMGHHINSSSHSSHSEALPPATATQRDSETVDNQKSQPAALEPSRNQAQARSQDTKADDCTRETSTTPQHCVILVQPMSSMNSMQEDGATEQRSDNHQISPPAVLNKTSNCPEIVDAMSLKLESVTDTDMATTVSLSEPAMAAAMSLRLESFCETAMAAATTEATPSLNATEVRVPAVPAVDSAAVDTTSVPLSSAAAAAALNQMDHLDNKESMHFTSEDSEPKKKKKKKKGIRRFFSRMMKALRSCFVPKDKDVK